MLPPLLQLVSPLSLISDTPCSPALSDWAGLMRGQLVSEECMELQVALQGEQTSSQVAMLQHL